MLLTIVGETYIRLDMGGEDGLNVEGDSFSSLQMLATSLALCSASVIEAYAETAGLDMEGLVIELRWEYVDGPHRVGRYDMTLHIPTTVPASRHRAIIRAADTCTVHATLLHPPTIETTLETFEPGHPPAIPHHHHHAEDEEA